MTLVARWLFYSFLAKTPVTSEEINTLFSLLGFCLFLGFSTSQFDLTLAVLHMPNNGRRESEKMASGGTRLATHTADVLAQQL